jgi:hypothetical protein
MFSGGVPDRHEQVAVILTYRRAKLLDKQKFKVVRR